MILENDVLRVEISSLGAEVRSIFDKTNGRELMWSGDSSWWNRVSPVLFPIVGSLNNKKFRYQGNEYEMMNHGFLRDTEMDLVSSNDSEVWYELESNSETKKMYPFDFVVRVGYVLRDNVLDVKWNVLNTSSDEMYFSIGAHPSFLAEEGDKFVIESNGVTNRYPVTDSGIDAPYEEVVSEVIIEPSVFVDDALVYDNTSATTLITKKADIRVTYDSFMYVGLWASIKNGEMSPFVCIEPWVGIADFVGFDGELNDKVGMVKLNSKEENAYIYSIEITSK